MGDRDDQQDERIEDVEEAAAAGEAHDEKQDRRLDDLEGGQKSGSEHDTAQDKRLDAVEHDLSAVELEELPGIDTPQGGEQRLKLQVPSPLTLMTLGAIGNNDADGHPVGAAGFALHTERNFAATITQHTIIDTDENVILHTPKNLTAVTGEQLHFGTNGDFKLGTVGSLSITAAGGANHADPDFTVDPPKDIPAPPAFDTAGPRSSIESGKLIWSSLWKAWDAYSGGMSLKKIKEDGLAKGIAKDQFAGKAAGLYSVYSNSRKLFAGMKAGWDAANAAIDQMAKKEPGFKAGKPKITIYADEGITALSPKKISIYSGNDGGVSVESPHKVGIKAGVSASMKAGADASVFSFISAKLESKGLAAVKGTIVSVSGDRTEVIGKDALHLSSKKQVLVTSDGDLRVSGAKKVELSGGDVTVGGTEHIQIFSDDMVDTIGVKRANLLSKYVHINGDEKVDALVKDSGLIVQDGDVKVGVGDIGVSVTSDRANIGTQQSFASFKGAGFQIKGTSPSKIKAPKIDLG